VTPTSRLTRPPSGLTVPVPAGLLHALLILATRDARTAVLTYPAWLAHARARLAATDQDLPTMSAALLVLDVDAFHDLNTAWGHPAGDQVLARIAEVLHDSGGAAPLVGRYGGDEFVVFVPGADLSHAREVAESIRARVAALQILVHGPHGEPVGVATTTVSIGVAAHLDSALASDPDEVLTGLFWAADAALYAAKDAGGNHVRPEPDRPFPVGQRRPSAPPPAAPGRPGHG
jgi:diguanylate cyclase (GGDEF)-like protein